MSFSTYYQNIFARMALDIGVQNCVSDAAWSYAKRMWKASSIDWYSNHVIAYTCISLAVKLWTDRDTSYPIVHRINLMMQDVFREDLATWEIRVSQALDWKLHYDHPIPPPPRD
jgi:hypothetical protein